MGNSCCGLSNPFEGEQNDSFPSNKRYFRKMAYQKPIGVTKGVNIKRNPVTGLYEGVPKEWVESNQIDLDVDISKVVTTSHLSSSIRPDPVLPENILSAIKSTQNRPPVSQGYQKAHNCIQVGNSSLIGAPNSYIRPSARDW